MSKKQTTYKLNKETGYWWSLLSHGAGKGNESNELGTNQGTMDYYRQMRKYGLGKHCRYLYY